MASAVIDEAEYAVVDASALIALCAREAGRHESVRAHLEALASAGCELFAPGVLVGECLYVFCRMKADERLTALGHALAVQSLDIMAMQIHQFPHGDAALVGRAVRILGEYGCSRSSDSLYLALAEALARYGTTELLTFDQGLAKHAGAVLPDLRVRVLAS